MGNCYNEPNKESENNIKDKPGANLKKNNSVKNLVSHLSRQATIQNYEKKNQCPKDKEVIKKSTFFAGVKQTNSSNNLGKLPKGNSISNELTDVKFEKNIKKLSSVKSFKRQNSLSSKNKVESIEENPRSLYQDFKLITEKDSIKHFKVNSILSGREYRLTQIINDNSIQLENESRDIEFLSKINHFHVIKFYKSFVYQNKSFSVKEHSENGYLIEKINNNETFSEYHAAIITYQLLLATSNLHKLGIMHRNIKFDNIFVSDYLIDKKYYYVKITDFKIAKKFHKDVLEEEIVGTPLFMSPEQVKGKYNEKCDVWSIGIILYSLISQESPFHGKTTQEIYENIISEDITYNHKFSAEIIKFLKELLAKKPSERLSAHQALEHKFFQNLRINQRFCMSDKKTKIILRNLNSNSFNIQNNFMSLIVSELPLSNEIFERMVVFGMIDEDKDGKITKEQIKEFLIGKNENSEIPDLNIFGDDPNFTKNYLNFSDFIQITLDKQMILSYSSLIYNILKYFSGTVTFHEMNKFFSFEDSSDNRVVRYFEERKLKLNSEINLDEFNEIFKGIIS